MKTKFSLILCASLASLLMCAPGEASEGEGGQAPSGQTGGRGSRGAPSYYDNTPIYRNPPAAAPVPARPPAPPETAADREARRSKIIVEEMQNCRDLMTYKYRRAGQCDARVLEHFITACEELRSLTEPIGRYQSYDASNNTKTLYKRVECYTYIQIRRSGRCDNESTLMNDSPYAQSVRYVDEFADGDDQFANDAVPAGPLFHLAQGGSPMTAEERLRLLQRGGQAPPPPQQPPPRAAPPAARQAPATDPAIREFDDRKRECIAQYPYN